MSLEVAVLGCQVTSLEGLSGAFALSLMLAQLPATAVLFSRLLRGLDRHPPLDFQDPEPDLLGAVSVVVPTLNEVERIDPCLEGLSRQSYEVREVIVVDSDSQDGTPERVKAIQQRDPRFRLTRDDPLPPTWVGRPWALHSGFLHTTEQSEWILGIDADTQPQPGLIPSLVTAAIAAGYDLVSLAPRFILKHPGEGWLHPALLVTLVYRFAPVGTQAEAPERVMANGQCFLCRRSVLARLGGYASARSSFCDDVTLARYAAAQGVRIGFLDGARLLKVRMYEGALETWREWGRSLDLKDAATPGQTWGDVAFLSLVQGLPVPMVVILLILTSLNVIVLPVLVALGLNLILVTARIGLLWAIMPSYEFRSRSAAIAFWFSPLADPFAVLRIILSALRRPTQWRGRSYCQVDR